MDPQATWQRLIDAWTAHDWEDVLDAAEALQYWLRRLGYPPETIPDKRMGREWNSLVVQTVCGFAAETAQRVLDDPHGIPVGVPFSLSCRECDAASPSSFPDAVTAGWTRMEFAPESMGENFFGLCTEHSNRKEE